MRILAINQFYSPDHAATSQLLTELCEYLAEAGDRVSVVASPGTYLGGGRLPATEVLGGVRVLRPFATSFGKATLPRRMADYLSFWAGAVGRAATLERPDVILALTTPPMIAAGGALVAAARRVPLVTWVQDVYPEAAVAFGVLGPESPTTRLLRAVARATHGATARIVALSAGMAERLEAQGASPSRLRVIPNWADGRLVRPVPHADNAFRREHGLEGRFVAMYSGNLGVGHDVATFVAAARRLEARRPDVLFVFIGEGARRAEAKRLASGLSNVRFLPYQPHARLAESLSAADIHLISLREGLEGLLVPSKLYGALASGRPICFVGPPTCEVARVVREGDLGWTGRSGDDGGLAGALAAAAADPAASRARGQRGRKIFNESFDRPISCAAWRAVLVEAARDGRPTA